VVGRFLVGAHERTHRHGAVTVLVVTPLMPQAGAVTGGESVRYGIVRALARRHEVVLATFARPEQTGARRALEADGVRVHTIDRGYLNGVAALTHRARLATRWAASDFPLRALAFRDARMQTLLNRLFDEHAFDAIQVEDHAMGSYAFRSRSPLVLTEHDAFGGEVRAGLFRSEELRRWRRFRALVWSRFEHIQVFTDRDAAEMASVSPAVADRVSVNPFGIDLPAPSDPAEERAHRVAFVGSFLHAPNVQAARELVLEVLPPLRALQPDVHLDIVGSHPPRSVRALERPGVAVHADVPDVGPYLAAAAVALAPIREGGGMRVKVLHAMALGKAVVTTPAGAAGIAAVGGEPPLVVSDSAAGLARATADLLADDGARRLLGSRARDYVAEHHNWKDYEMRLGRLYDSLGGA